MRETGLPESSRRWHDMNGYKTERILTRRSDESNMIIELCMRQGVAKFIGVSIIRHAVHWDVYYHTTGIASRQPSKIKVV